MIKFLKKNKGIAAGLLILAVIVCLADKYCAVLESMFQRTRVADTDAADNEW